MTEDLLPLVTEFAERARPPLAVTGSSNSSSMIYAVVEVSDGHVVWRFVRERSVLRLEASPVWDPSVAFDADLLRRFLGYEIEPERHTAGSMEALRDLMAISMDDLAAQLEELRQPIAATFDESTWDATRWRLLDLGRRRDAELFGRPYHPPER